MVIAECSKRIREYMNQTEPLSDYVLRVSAENETSLTEIERIAKRKGFSITQGYISKIIS